VSLFGFLQLQLQTAQHQQTFDFDS